MPVSSLFLHSTVGRAHIAASRAVSAALSPEWHREEHDYLEFLPAFERKLWPALYHLMLEHAPSMWRAWRRLTDRPGEPRAFDRVSKGTEAFAKLLAVKRPQLVVSTISGAATLAGAARERIGAAFLNAVVVTHFRAHRHWARREADLFCVATDETREDLVRHGIAADRVIVTGTPIRPIVRGDKRALRTRLGIGDDPAVVVSSGGTGKYRAFDELLDELEALDRPLDVFVFKGDAAATEHRGRARIHRLGFRDDFVDFLCAADACIGKLGSLTAAEACAAGAPIVVWEPIPGPEEDNAQYLVDRGAALWPRERRALRTAIGDVLDGRGNELVAAASQVFRPGAAQRIARLLEERC